MSDPRESSDQVRNQFQQQLQNALGSMPLSSKILTGVLTVLVLFGLSYLVRGENRSHNELLFGGRLLSEQELDSVELSFSQAGLNDWDREGRRISIPSQNRSDYLAALQDSSVLPISIRSSLQGAIDKTTIFESSSQRLAREEHAKEIDLGHKLSAFHEIAWASVEYDEGERMNLGGARAQSASVVVSPEGNEPLSTSRIHAIKEFVRGSYSGMRNEDVVVTDTNANSRAGQSNDPRHQIQQEEQARLETQVREILCGYGPIRVAAYIELPPANPPVASNTAITTSPVTVAPHSTPNVHVVRRQEPASSTRDSTGGNLLSSVFKAVTQVRSNRPARIAGQSHPAEASIPPVATLLPSPIQSTRNVQVSVGLPESYYHRVWEHAYLREHAGATLKSIPTPDEARLRYIQSETETNIRAAITPAVLAAAQFVPRYSSAAPQFSSNAAQLASLVQIWTYPDLPNAETVKPDFAAVAIRWLEVHWQQVGFVIMGLFGLWIAARTLRSMGSSSTNQSVVSERPIESRVAASGFDSQQIAAENPASHELEYGDLLELVEQNPDAAANVIRDWVVKAA